MTLGPDAILVVFVFLFGLIAGGFATVLTSRLEGVTGSADALLARVAHPPSACATCRRPLGWLEKLPAIGWLYTRGRCSSCHAKVELSYPLVEVCAAAIVLCLFMAWRDVGLHFGVFAAFAGAAAVLLTVLSWQNRETTTSWLLFALVGVGLQIVSGGPSPMAAASAIAALLLMAAIVHSAGGSCRSLRASSLAAAGLAGWIGPVALAIVPSYALLCRLVGARS